jgi:hypothetical protein
MNQRKALWLGAAAVLAVAAGVFLNLQRSSRQADLGSQDVFPDLEASLAEVTEIRLSKGDGSRVTLRKGGKTPSQWTVAERQYPADPVRIRELALGLAKLRVVEAKTSDPANYPKLGVETPDTPAATGTLVEVVAGPRTWSLIVGKGADGRAIYVRRPAEAGSLLAAPFLTVDPDQLRWIDRLLVDLPGAGVHEIAVKPGKGPAYLLSRAGRDAGLALSPTPRGRAAASSMVLGGQVEALASFHFDDVRAVPDPPPAYPDKATWRTFDGQVIEFNGRRDGENAYVTVTATRDAALAAKFAPPPAAAAPAPGEKAPADEAKAAEGKPAAENTAGDKAPAADGGTSAKPAEEAGANSVERLATRVTGVEYQIPVYKYESLFKPLEELLEPKK